MISKSRPASEDWTAASVIGERHLKPVCPPPWPFVMQDYNVRVPPQEVPGVDVRLHVGCGLASQGSRRRKNVSK